MPPTIEHLKRLKGRFLAVPREYKYFCRDFGGTPSLPATILRIYVYESETNNQFLDLSEVDLGERMDWEWGERRIASARQFLIRTGLLRQENPRSGCRARIAVNCELLDREESALPENWEEKLMERVRPSMHRCRPKPAQKSTGTRVEAAQKGTGSQSVPVPKGGGTGAEKHRSECETGANMHRCGNVSLSIQKLPEDQEERLASFPLDTGAKEDEAYVHSEVEQGVAGRVLGGRPADAGTILNLTKHLASLRFEDRVLAWQEIYDCYRRASSWGLPVSIAQRYAKEAEVARRKPVGREDQSASRLERYG